MKILYIVPYVPNPVRVRPYNLIQFLAKRGHQITLATLTNNPAEDTDVEALRAFCRQVMNVRLSRQRVAWNALRALFSSMPIQANWSWQPQLAAEIGWQLRQTAAGETYDVIHVEHLRGARYGLSILARGSRGDRPPIIWDSVDSISLLFRQTSEHSYRNLTRQIARFELGRTERYESWLASRFDATLVTSTRDQAAFLALAGLPDPHAPVRVIPNGVDSDHFFPGSGPRDPATLIVSGKMSYHANVAMVLWLMHEVMPRVWARLPQAQLLIVGKDPPREIQAFSQHPSVQVTGTVQDIVPFLQKSTIAVAPIPYGVGIQNKVLEAMATATPVVTTPQGNSALSAISGRDLVVATGAEEFAEKVLYLLQCSPEQKRIGDAGRAYVMTHHRWEQIATELEALYQETIATRSNSKTKE